MKRHNYYINSTKIYERTEKSDDNSVTEYNHHCVSIYEFLALVLDELEELRRNISV